MIVRRYTADWCGPCKKYGPVFEDVALDPRFSMVTFDVVDVDVEPAVAEKHAVTNIPRTDILLDEDHVSLSRVGVMSADELRLFITDMLAEFGVSL